MGLYKLCEHKGRARDRCEHAWWARFRHVRVSLEKWSDREIKTKTEADAVLDDMRKQDAIGGIRQLGDDLKKENGLSMAQCEFWSDTMDRWAEDLVDPTKGGT